MQSNISLNFIKITEIIDENKVLELNSFLDYHLNSRITCNDIANRLDISFEDAKKIARILLKTDILEMNFKVDCCDEYSTTKVIYYDVFEEIPDEVCCNCDKKCQLLRNIIIVYKVMKGSINE